MVRRRSRKISRRKKNVSTRRVSKRRVSKKLSSRRRVSKKRSSRRRVSKKRSTKRRVSKKNKRSRQRGGVLPPDERGHRQPGTYKYPDPRPTYQKEIDKLITKIYQSEDCHLPETIATIAVLGRQIHDVNIDITRKRSAAATAAQKREAVEMTIGKRAAAAAAAAQKREEEEEGGKTDVRYEITLLKKAIDNASMATGRGDATASPSGSGAGADEEEEEGMETDGCTKYLNALAVLVNNIITQL
jgi:hypothetical protein